MFGIVQPDGRVGYLGGEIPVNAVRRQSQGRTKPGAALPLHQPVRRGSCRQWTGSRCGVADKVMAEAGPQEPALPDCGIRAHCRWHMQSGADACAVCSLVTRE